MCTSIQRSIARYLRVGVFHVLLVTLWCANIRPAAADWARDMFEVTQHDFGTIAAGAKAEFAFKFTNTYLYDVHVARVRSSCGCSNVRVTKNSLATYESGEVVASINSQRLRGNQSSTLTVVFDKPRYAEVQLKVTVYIRGDILLKPSGFDFGELEQGTDASRKLTVTHYGDANWKIIDILGGTDRLECELGAPVVSGNRVSYELTARIAAGAPAGSLGTQLLLVTNDPQAERIPMMVQGSVRSLVSVAPASLYLGSLRPGQSVSKRLVVRAAKPFHIRGISTDCDCFQFTYACEEAKALHFVPVTFTAGSEAGAVKRTIRIRTDMNNIEAEILAMAAIDEQAK